MNFMNASADEQNVIDSNLAQALGGILIESKCKSNLIVYFF